MIVSFLSLNEFTGVSFCDSELICRYSKLFPGLCRLSIFMTKYDLLVYFSALNVQKMVQKKCIIKFPQSPVTAFSCFW